MSPRKNRRRRVPSPCWDFPWMDISDDGDFIPSLMIERVEAIAFEVPSSIEDETERHSAGATSRGVTR